MASTNMKPLGISFETEMPASATPSSPPKRFLRHERPIGPRQDVRVHRVDLAELRAHLAGLQQQTRRQRRERDVALFHFQTLRAGREEEVRARIRIDDRLKGGLDLGQRQRRLIAHRVLSGDADEVADDRNVGVEHLLRRRPWHRVTAACQVAPAGRPAAQAAPG